MIAPLIRHCVIVGRKSTYLYEILSPQFLYSIKGKGVFKHDMPQESVVDYA